MNWSVNIKSLAVAVSALVLSTSASAALIERMGGLAYYDDEADLTWLQDANATGIAMNWLDATAWAASLDVDGITGWRLPLTLAFDSTCSSTSGAVTYGVNCTGSELGNMFYNVLGGSANINISSSHNTNYDLFSNIILVNRFWSETARPDNTSIAFNFRITDNGQYVNGKGSSYFAAWAVQTGDAGLGWVAPEVSTVPVPAAAWLFGSGLLGLVGFARRKKA